MASRFVLLSAKFNSFLEKHNLIVVTSDGARRFDLPSLSRALEKSESGVTYRYDSEERFVLNPKVTSPSDIFDQFGQELLEIEGNLVQQSILSDKNPTDVSEEVYFLRVLYQMWHMVYNEVHGRC